MLRKSRRRLSITVSTYSESVFAESFHTLSNKASNELLFLDGGADAALEIALVEHARIE